MKQIESIALSKYLLLLALLVYNSSATGQAVLKQADKEFSRYNYVKAIGLYIKAFEKNKPTAEQIIRLADCYRLTNNTQEAETWYAQVVADSKSPAINTLHYANMLKSNGKCNEAMVQYKQYASQAPQDEAMAAQLIKSCAESQKWIERPRPVQIVADSVLNSPYADFSPAFFDKNIIFTSNRKILRGKKEKSYKEGQIDGWTGNPYLMLYQTQATENTQSAAKALVVALPKLINTKYHNGPATYSDATKTLVYSRAVIDKKSSKQKTPIVDGAFTNRSELFITTYQNGVWQKPVPFAYNNKNSYSITQPALSPDGKTLFFVSDMQGGFGSSDIYYSELVDNRWSPPVNLGNAVNTAGRDGFPYISADGVLYFSSDGHLGMGGLDIFAAEGKGNNWKTPTNLRFPFNTNKDDFGIIFDATGKSGYLSSNRNGNDDIFGFKVMKPDMVLLATTVKGLKTYPGAPEVTFQILDEKGEVVALVSNIMPNQPQATAVANNLGQNQQTQNSSVSKRFYELEKGKRFTIKVFGKGYDTVTHKIYTDTISTTDTFKLELPLKQKLIVVNGKATISIQDIYFDFNQAVITPKAMPELNQIAILVKTGQIRILEITGHTDSRGPTAYNQWLSEQRANAAAFYLYSQGVTKRRVVTKGFGETMLLNNCKDGVDCNEEMHAMNRRTTFRPYIQPEPVILGGKSKKSNIKLNTAFR